LKGQLAALPFKKKQQKNERKVHQASQKDKLITTGIFDLCIFFVGY
jgi:hypothetical protein